MGKSSSKKRSRAADEDVADAVDNASASTSASAEQTAPIVKKSKIDKSGKAEVTKNGSGETPIAEAKEKKEKKEKKKKEKEEKGEKKDKSDKKEKKEKKEKKAKIKDVDDEDVVVENEAADELVANGTETPSKEERKKSKKEKKEKKSKKTKSSTSEGQEEPVADAASEAGDTDAEANGDASSKSNRFICFIGNLPYTATADAIRTHFASVHPTNVRLLTEKGTSKPRGIAFIEFARYDYMKTCLEKFHHTEFDDGISPARKINVELTAGGGGKTPHRQEKIAAKNKKLNEERAQRITKEEAAKQEKAVEQADQQQSDSGWIHPSRLGRVPHGEQTQEQRDQDAALYEQSEKKWDGSGGKFRNKRFEGRAGGRGGGRGGRGKFRGGR